MADPDNSRSVLPPHVAETIQAIAAVHTEHYQKATPLQQMVHGLTATVGRPAFVVILMLAALGWICLNLALMWIGYQPWDPPPFAYLTGAVSLAALYTTLLILTTQRHDDELARQREQLTLHIAILAEQKSAKIIEMLKQIHAESPHLSSHTDHEANDMSDAADPHQVLDAIKGAQRPVSRGDPRAPIV